MRGYCKQNKNKLIKRNEEKTTKEILLKMLISNEIKIQT